MILEEKQENPDVVLQILRSVVNQMESDFSAAEMEKFFERLEEYRYNGVIELAGETVSNAEYTKFYPDEALLQQTILKLLYTQYSE